MDEQHICGSVSYIDNKGRPIHSDICIIGDLTDEYKEFLMLNFAEFLDNFHNHPNDCRFNIGSSRY